MTAASPARAQAQAHRGAGVTEREARDRIAPRVGTLRAAVLRLVVDAGPDGLTALEAWELHYESPNGVRPTGLYSVAPRLSELESDGYVEVDGARLERVDGVEQPGTTRRQVYVATDSGRAWAEAHR